MSSNEKNISDSRNIAAVARAHQIAGKLTEARSAYQAALDLFLSMRNPSSIQVPEVTHDAADVCVNLAFLEAELGNYDDALRYVDLASTISQESLDITPHRARIEFLAARSTNPNTRSEIAGMEATVAAIETELERDSL